MCVSPSILANFLSSALGKSQVTQADLARNLNVTRGTISNIFNGNDLPSDEVLRGIANNLKLNETKCERLLVLERQRRSMPQNFESFNEGAQLLTDFVLRQDFLESQPAITIDLIVTWLRSDASDKEESLMEILNRLVSELAAAKKPKLKLRICTTAPTNFGLLSSRVLHSTLDSLKGQQRQGIMESGIGRVAGRVADCLGYLQESDAWLSALCSKYQGNPFVEIEHRYNFAWTGYPVFRLDEFFAICGYYPSASGYCRSPSHAQFLGSPDYTMVADDIELIWNRSIPRGCTSQGLGTPNDEDSELIKKIDELYSNSKGWKGMLALYLEFNLGDYVLRSIKSSQPVQESGTLKSTMADGERQLSLT